MQHEKTLKNNTVACRTMEQNRTQKYEFKELQPSNI